MRLKWIIQDALLAEDNLLKLINAIDELGWEYKCVGMIPFSHEITGDLEHEADCVYIGNGYRAEAFTLEILNIIKIDKAGKLIAENAIGMSKKAPVWVFK